MRLLFLFCFAPFLALSQGAPPVLDLNSPRINANALSGNASNLISPFSAGTGWTRNSDTEVKTSGSGDIFFDKNDPSTALTATSPEISGMKLGGAPSGAGQIVVSWAWNHGEPAPGSGHNVVSVIYNDIVYATLTTVDNSNNDGLVTYLNGATNAAGNMVQTNVPVSPSTGTKNFTTTTINLPISVTAGKSNIVLRFETTTDGKDDIFFNFVRALRSGDDDYNFANTLTENGPLATIADTDMSIAARGSSLSGATFQLTNTQTGDALRVIGALPAGINMAYFGDSTILTFTGSTTIANYETAIKQVRFANRTENPSTVNRIINVVVGDGVSSNTAVATISVIAVNDAPLGTDKTFTILEDATVTFAASDFGFSDAAENNAFQSVTIATLGTTGTLRLNGAAVTANQVIPVASIPQLTWKQNVPGASGDNFDSFTFKVTDNGGTANGGVNTGVTANKITFNLTPVVFAPVIDLDGSTPGSDYAVISEQIIVKIGKLVSVTDADPGENLASMKIELTNGATASNPFSVVGTLPAGITASYSLISGIGTFTLTGSATPAAYQTALGQIQFTAPSITTTNYTIRVSATSTVAPTASNVATTTITILDSDGDGVVNAVDIDDDNDGVLDTNEMACVTSTSTIHYISHPDGALNGTSGTSTTAAPNNYSIATSGAITSYDGGPVSATIVSTTAATRTSPAIVTYTFTKPVNNLVIRASHFNSSGTPALAEELRVTGTKSNATVTSLKTVGANVTQIAGTEWYASTSTATPTGDPEAVLFTFNDPVDKIVIEEHANARAGANGVVIQLLAGCDVLDTDNDNVPNHLDLDSDGDGCPDAVEAGTAAKAGAGNTSTGTVVNTSGTQTGVAKAVVGNGTPANYGANGFYNGIESNDSATATYTDAYSYTQFGLNPNISACKDTDGDGIPDVIDIDDDNDGVLDLTEGCTLIAVTDNFITADANGTFGNFATGTKDLQNPPGTPYTYQSVNDAGGGGDYTVTVGNYAGTWNNIWVNQKGHTDGSNTDAYLALNGASTQGVIYKATFTINTLGTYRASFYGAVNNPQPEMGIRIKNSAGTVIIDKSTEPMTAASTVWDLKYIDTQITATGTYTMELYNISTAVYGNDFSIDDASFARLGRVACTRDTDNDGITDNLDLDSDGDGCSDAYESNATSNKTANFQFTPANGGYVDANGDGLTDIKDTDKNGIPDYVFYPYAYDSTLNFCSDFDNDGVPDLVDIDDDNDGIEDAVESPSCFVSGRTMEDGVRTGMVTISSTLPLNTDPAYSDLSQLVDGDKGTTDPANVAIAFQGGTLFNKQEILKFKFIYPIKLKGIYLGYINSVPIFSVSSPVLFQGSMDGINWVDLTAVTSYGTTPSNGTILNQPTLNYNSFIADAAKIAPYSYYRLYGVSGTTNGNAKANEVYFDVSSDYVASDFPLNTCTENADGTGGPNHQDLDSDGDGCSDSYEGGAITTEKVNNQFITQAGTSSDANGDGLADVVDTNQDRKADYILKPYAYNASLSLCKDGDGDGVGDLDDIDDDNDGILDAVENPACYYAKSDFESGNRQALITASTPITTLYPGSDITKLLDGVYIASAVADRGIRFNDGTNFSNQEFIKYTFASPIAIDNIYHVYSDYGTSGTTGKSSFPAGVTTIIRVEGSNNNSTWTPLSANTTYDEVADGICPFATAYGKADKFSITQNKAKYKYYRLFLTKGSVSGEAHINETFFEFTDYSASANPKQTCTSLDTDNDGIVNNLDLDSDGDGCPDAVEAGTAKKAGAGNTSTGTLVNTSGTQTGVANAIVGNGVATSYGANGFYNGIESNDLTSATYTGTYTYTQYAIVSSVSACTDSDGDGILDVDDLDDDNDGILDVNEQVACGRIKGSDITVSGPGTIANVNNNEDGTMSSWGNDDINTNTDAGNLYAGPIKYTFSQTKTINKAKLYNAWGFRDEEINEWYVKLYDAAGTLLYTSNIAQEPSSTWATSNAAPYNDVNYVRDAPSESEVSFAPVANVKTMEFIVKSKLSDRITSPPVVTTFADVNSPSATNSEFREIDAFEPCNPDIDTDGDGIPNRLDLDSDGDGCPDAKEGSGGFMPTNNSSMPGGNTGGSYTGYATPVIINLGNTVDANGIPTIATASGQGVGTSITKGTDGNGNKVSDNCEATDVSITKTVNNASPNVGSNVTFTITVKSMGSNAATSVSAIDALPSGYTFVSATPSGTTTFDTSTNTWTIGTLSNGASATLAIVATVKSSGEYKNTATVTIKETDPTPANNTASVTPVPIAANLSVNKTVSNAGPDVGTDVTFTITASNAGPSNATSVVVIDPLPTGYSFVSATASGSTSYNNSNGTWTIGTLNNGTSATLTILAKVNPAGDYANKATISGAEPDPMPTDNSSTSTTVPGAVSDLSVTKTVSNATPNVGSNVTFTITPGNAGPSNATATKVNDLLPSGYTFVSATPSVGTYDSSTGVWTIGTLIKDATGVKLDIVAKVNASGVYANTATISATETDPILSNNTSTSTPTPVAQSDISVLKTASNDKPNVGNNVTFTIAVKNNGPSDATGVKVTDLLPTGYSFVSATTPGSTTYDTTTGVWTIGNLANGITTTLNIVATVKASGVYANTATVSVTEGDPTSGNNTSTSTPTPIATADLSVNKTVSNDKPNVGTNVTFTIVAANAGASDATVVKVNDILPTGYTFVSAAPSVGTYDSTTGLWAIGNLANGTNRSLTIVARVNASGDYANKATISATEADLVPSNNTSTSTTVPVAQADVSVVKTVSNDKPNVGTNVTFTIVVTNNGPSDATTVKATDLLPTGYTFVSAIIPAGTTYDSATGVWTIGNLANGVNTTLNITATVKASGVYANTATVSATQADPTLDSNTSTSTPTPIATADLSIVKTVSNDKPNVGTNVTFTLTAGNAGPSNGTVVKVNDILPSGYTFVSATPSVGTYDSTTGLWAIGAFAKDAIGVKLDIVAKVNASGDYANKATISATEADLVPSNNTSTSTTVPVAVADVSVLKTVSNDKPNVGTNVTFTIVAANAGPSDATTVKVTDLLPTGYTFVSAMIPAGTTYDSATGVWTIGNLANGVNTTLNITATVKASGVYANTATVSATQADPTLGNNTSTSTPVPVSQADLSIVKTISKVSPNVGNNVTFTLIANNTGPSDATTVKVNDLLPSGYTFVSATPSVGTYDTATGVWTIGTLANGASAVTLNIVAKVNATGSYTNVASISATEADPNTANNSSSISSTPIDVKIVKTGPAKASTGTTVTYNLSIINDGSGNAVSYLIKDAVPAELTNVTWTATASGSATINSGATGTGNSITINADIPAGGSNNISVSITGQLAASSTASTLSNTATATSPDPLDLVVNSNTVTTTVERTADISIQKTGPTTAVAGSNILYTIKVTNAGPSNANNVNIVDNLPAGIIDATWTATVQNGAAITGATSGTGNINLFASIPTGTASVTITINGKINGAYTGTTLSNTATATPESGVTDPSPATSTVNTTITRVANVRIIKSGPANIGAGEEIIYDLIIDNIGPSDATGVVIADLLPTQVQNATWTVRVFNGATLTGAASNPMSGSGDINMTADIPAGTGASVSSPSVIITVIGKVAPSVVDKSSFSNTATANLPVGSPITDPEVTNNSSTITTNVNNTIDVRVSKSGPAVTNIFDFISYSIVVTNAAPADVTNALLRDLVPSSVTVSTWTVIAEGDATITGPTDGPDVATPSNPNLIETTISIPANKPNAKIILTIIGTVNSTASATITNTVNVMAGGNPSSSFTTAINKSTDIAIQKSAPQSASAGSAISYTIKVVNNGPVPVTGLTISDDVPADIENVTWSAAAFGTATLTGSNGAGSTGNSIQTKGDIPVGATNFILITVNGNIKSSTTATKILNTAIVALPNGEIKDFNLDNNNSTAETTVTKESDLSVVKTTSATAPVVGTNITFSIVASNAGPSDATNVKVNEALASGYTFVSATPSVGTYDKATGVWTIGNLAKGASATLSVVSTVNTTGSYTNTVTIAGTEPDPIPSNNTSAVTPGPRPSADVSVTKTASSMTPNVGSNVTFTITAKNNGPSSATGISVHDLLANGYTFVSAIIPTGTTYNNSSGTWTIGSLASGGSSVLTITATVNAAGLYSNTASITATEDDPNTNNNSVTITPVPAAVANLSVTKTASNMMPLVGNSVIFNIVVANSGPSNATNVLINDPLPSGYTFVSATTSTGTSYNATGVWTVGDLANDANATLAITATVNATGNYANTAKATATEGDPDPDNSTTTITPTPLPVANLTVVKTADNNTPSVGSNVVFSIKVSNAGPSTATDVKINDLLPTGYTFVSANAPVGTSYNNTTGLWTIGDLVNGATRTLTITAKVNPTGNYTNTANVITTTTDPTPEDAGSTITPKPIPTANLSITKTASNITPLVGDDVVFNIVLTNTGPSDATGVSAIDLLPSGYTFISATTSVGTSYNSTTGVWTIGNLANGTNVILTVTAKVKVAGNYTNSVTVTTTEPDPDPKNNETSITPTPLPVANLTVVKTVDNATPIVGNNVVFSIKVSNAGPSTAADVKVNDLLPTGYTFVSANAPVGTSYNNTTGLWTIGDLANGATMTLTITAKVNPIGNYTNTANVITTTTDPTPEDAGSTITPKPTSMANLSITKAASNMAPLLGNTVIFNIAVTNAGPSNATGVLVNDLLPAGYTFVSAAVSTGTSYNNATGVWLIGNLANGANATLAITTTVNATGGSYTNTAKVTATETDPDLSNNSASVTPVPILSANLSVVKTIDNSTPKIGDNVVFSIKASNAGPNVAPGIKVNELLSSGYTFVTAFAPAGTSYNNVTGIWTIGDLANGATVTLTITAKVNSSGNYSNTASIITTITDPTPGDNSSTITPVPTVNKPLAEDNIVPLKDSKAVVIPILENDNPGYSTFDMGSIEIIDPPKHGTIKINSDGTVTYTPNPGYHGDDSFTYRVKDEFGNFTNVATVSIKANLIDVKIPNYFTPNGDGTNDRFEITMLDQFAANSLVIVNRWGNEVYHSTNYQNTWTGEGLNEGTYYYILKLKRNNDSEWVIYKGWFLLMRSVRK